VASSALSWARAREAMTELADLVDRVRMASASRRRLGNRFVAARCPAGEVDWYRPRDRQEDRRPGRIGSGLLAAALATHELEEQLGHRRLEGRAPGDRRDVKRH